MRYTVKSLITALEKLPQDAIVMVDGYEGGLADISQTEQATVKLNYHTEDYMGPHEEDEKGTETAVILRRQMNPLS